jgi:hypothetical protein
MTAEERMRLEAQNAKAARQIVQEDEDERLARQLQSELVQCTDTHAGHSLAHNAQKPF